MQSLPDSQDVQVPRPAHLHVQQPDYLSHLYEAWLGMPIPGHPDGRQVAGTKVRNGIVQGRAWALEDRAAWSALWQTWERSPDHVWVWSDLHLNHANILPYTGRPFNNVQSMNDMLLAEAQRCVGKDDWLVFVGDVSFGGPAMTRAWLRECPGHHALVLGNHDVDRKARDRDPRSLGFEAVSDSLDWRLSTPVLTADGQSVQALWFTHYPLWNSWIPPNALNVHGHLHDKLLSGRRANVCVEQQDYAPVRLIDRVRQHRSLSPAEAEDLWDASPPSGV